MLTWLRDNAKIFLIITIVIFVALVFLQWGMDAGSGPSADPYRRPVAVVDGKEILPAEYSETLQAYNRSYRNELEATGHPDPEAAMMLLGERVREEAFRGMIAGRLEESYLSERGWGSLTPEQAEALLEAQVGLQGEGVDPEEYVDRLRSEQPGLYQQYLVQSYQSASAMRYPLAVGLLTMASGEEVSFSLMDSRGTMTARYVTFSPQVPLPEEGELLAYYEQNTGEFYRQTGSLLRYVTVLVTPDEEDAEEARATADSLSFATAGELAAVTRGQLEDYFGPGLELTVGERTMPFAAPSGMNPSIEAYHVILTDSVHRPQGVDTASAADTLYLRLWEAPVLPGYGTVRSTLWDMQDSMEGMLAATVPEVPDTLQLVSFGEMMIDSATPVTGDVTRAMKAFATDTLWSDDTGPVFYHPQYRGGYPALTVMRRLEFMPADTLSYEEAMETGELLQAVRSARIREEALEMATSALEDMERSGVSLWAWAEQETLAVETTPSFTASQVRSSAAVDADPPTGLLSSEEFAYVALTAPELQVVGPFVIRSGCVLAEITSRQAPADNPTLRSMAYAATETGREQYARSALLSALRESAEVRDLREEWQDYAEAVEDSLSALEEQEETETD